MFSAPAGGNMAADRQQGAVVVLSSDTKDVLHRHCSPESAVVHQGVKINPWTSRCNKRIKKKSCLQDTKKSSNAVLQMQSFDEDVDFI